MRRLGHPLRLQPLPGCPGLRLGMTVASKLTSMEA
jgi:hypothetical protein